MEYDSYGFVRKMLDGRLVPQAIAERLLTWTVPDLRHRTREDASHYETLGLAAILRRTIADGNSVVHAARERLRLPSPEFQYRPFSPRPDPTGGEGGRWVPILGFSGREFAEPIVTGTLAQFLAAPVAHHREAPVSVKRVISYFAHVEGGVHLGRPDDEFEALTQRLVASIDVAGLRWAGALSGIALATVRALEPLEEAIAAQPIIPPHQISSRETPPEPPQ